MELNTSNIRKYGGTWKDFVDREENSMDHLIQTSFAELSKEVKSYGNQPESSGALNYGSLSRSAAKKVSPPTLSSTTMPRRLSKEPGYIPPGIRELESLYAPMKTLDTSSPMSVEMPRPAPLRISGSSEDDCGASVMGDIPPHPPPVQSHAVLQESRVYSAGNTSNRKYPEWKTGQPPAPPKRSTLFRPDGLRLSRESTPSRPYRTSLMSTGSSESSGSTSLPSSSFDTPASPGVSGTNFFGASIDEYEYPLRSSSRTDAEEIENEYVTMRPVFTSDETSDKSTHYTNLLYIAVSGEGTALLEHVYEEPKTKKDSALRRHKKRAKAKAEFEELKREIDSKRLYRIGLNLFNSCPDSGIEFLVSENFLELSPTSVARFLKDCSGLSKDKVGEFLGNVHNPFSVKVLSRFLDDLDFSGLRIDKALRKLLEYFKIPAEADRIKIILETFGKRFVKCNPGFCKSAENPADSAVNLAVAIMFLNTDLHVSKKEIDFEQFSKNSEVKDPKILKPVYKGVKKAELRIGLDHVYKTIQLQNKILDNGKKIGFLAEHHRRLVCMCRMYKVMDIGARNQDSLHPRDIFLFNDLLLVTKRNGYSKKPSYSMRESHHLLGVSLILFHTPVFKFGVQLCRNDREVLTLNAGSELDRYNFVVDVQEAILEMEQTESAKRKLSGL